MSGAQTIPNLQQETNIGVLSKFEEPQLEQDSVPKGKNKNVEDPDKVKTNDQSHRNKDDKKDIEDLDEIDKKVETTDKRKQGILENPVELKRKDGSHKESEDGEEENAEKLKHLDLGLVRIDIKETDTEEEKTITAEIHIPKEEGETGTDSKRDKGGRKEKRGRVEIFPFIGCIPFIGPIALITIGSMYVGDCTIDPKIPVYLIVAGVFGLIHPAANQRLRVLLTLFLEVWFICGCVWVYKVYTNVNFLDRLDARYCHKTLYLFAFWILNLGFIAIGFLLIGYCEIYRKQNTPVRDHNHP